MDNLAYNDIYDKQRTDEEKEHDTLSLKVSLYDDMIVDVREVFEDMIE